MAVKGSKLSEETRRKIGQGLMGRAGPNKGKKLSEEWRKKMSESHKGIKQSDEWKNKRIDQLRGRKLPPLSEEHKQKVSEGLLRHFGPVRSYDHLHIWVGKHLPKPELCQTCNERPPYDLANISPEYNPETYTRDLKNWRWMCRRCHLFSDGRLERLWEKTRKR